MKGSFAELAFVVVPLNAAMAVIALTLPSESAKGVSASLYATLTIFLIIHVPCYVWDAICTRSRPTPFLLESFMSGNIAYVVGCNAAMLLQCDRLSLADSTMDDHSKFMCLILLVYVFLGTFLRAIGSDIGIEKSTCFGPDRLPPPGPYPKTMSLITVGPYAFVRNPMILFLVVALVIRTQKTGSASLALYTVCFFVIMTAWFKFFEEPDLKEKFGEEYEKYYKNVPRWIPRVAPYKKIRA